MRKPDANEREIVDALKKLGAYVVRLECQRAGVPDLLVGWRGRTYLLEVKTPATGPRGGGAGSLTQEQREFMRDWNGGIAMVVHGADEALHALGILPGIGR